MGVRQILPFTTHFAVVQQRDMVLAEDLQYSGGGSHEKTNPSSFVLSGM
jgi:hypothetical protein